MQLKKLVVHKYRNVTPGTSLVFNPGKNVLLGKNGTGKSTLLSLIATVVSSDFSRIVGEDFSIDYEVESPNYRFSASVQNEVKSPLNLGLSANALESESVGLSLGLLSLGHEPMTGQFTWSSRLERFDASLVVKVTNSALGLRADVEMPSMPNGMSTSVKRSASNYNVVMGSLSAAIGAVDVERQAEVMEYLFGFISGVADFGQTRFDESLGFFDRMLSAVLDFVSVDPSRAGFLPASSGVPIALIRSALAVLKANAELNLIDCSSVNLGFLSDATTQMGFSSGRLRLERIQKRLNEGVEFLQFGKMSFDFTREDGSAINHSLLSFGQKRLLAFWCYLHCYPNIVVADELVNGLHHHWIENCLSAMGERQAFLTSQNPLLLDYLYFESAEQARSAFVLCQIDKLGKQERMNWSNMTEDDSGRFFSAYQSGIQHVSEILRDKGLW